MTPDTNDGGTTGEAPPSGNWKQKAMAFVTRSHRHLWGKNNENPLAYLFERGLSNDFAKKMLIGWNKFGQNRPGKNWGLEGTLFLPSGLVIPYIIDKHLTSVFIHEFEKNGTPSSTIPGSRTSELVLGKKTNTTLIIPDLMDGLFLAQQTSLSVRIIIQPGEIIMPASPTGDAGRFLFLNPIHTSHPQTDSSRAGAEVIFYETNEELLQAVAKLY